MWSEACLYWNQKEHLLWLRSGPQDQNYHSKFKKKAIQAGLAALITQYVILWVSQLKERTLRCTNFLRCQFFFLCILLVFSIWKWKSTESESHGTESFHQKRLLSNSAESQGLGNNLRSSKVQHCWHSQDVWNCKVGYLYFLIVSGFITGRKMVTEITTEQRETLKHGKLQWMSWNWVCFWECTHYLTLLFRLS